MSSPFTQRSLVRRRADRDRAGGGGGTKHTYLLRVRLRWFGAVLQCSRNFVLILLSINILRRTI